MRGGNAGLGRAAECGEIGTDRHIFEQTAHRAGTVERALRPAQHLDPVEIEQADIERKRGGV
jgi:hypothetical protein